MKIALIGTGNIAWHLGRALENAGHVIAMVYNRDLKKAEAFAYEYYNAHATNRLKIPSAIDVVILCLPDDVIEEVGQHLQIEGKAIVCHTSGTRPLADLGYAQTHDIGVFYPLQTFTKGKKLNFFEVPIFVEADNRNALRVLEELGKSISKQVVEMGSKERAVLHLSAVFACNFANHMLSISKGILDQHNLKFDWLKPLIVETINKSLALEPENAQTGPAKRADLETLDRQHQALSNDESVAEIYRLVSQHIMDFYSVEDS